MYHLLANTYKHAHSIDFPKSTVISKRCPTEFLGKYNFQTKKHKLCSLSPRTPHKDIFLIKGTFSFLKHAERGHLTNIGVRDSAIQQKNLAFRRFQSFVAKHNNAVCTNSDHLYKNLVQCRFRLPNFHNIVHAHTLALGNGGISVSSRRDNKSS